MSAREDPEASSHRDGASLIELEPPGISSPVHPGQSEVGKRSRFRRFAMSVAVWIRTFHFRSHSVQRWA